MMYGSPLRYTRPTAPQFARKLLPIRFLEEAPNAATKYREVSAGELGTAGAMAWRAWAGASGGAYGRRRGGAAGRLGAWWAAATLAGLEWPGRPEELGRVLGRMGWVLWEPPGFALGWGLHLAGEVPGEGLGFAVAATDARREAEGQSGG